MKEEKQMDGPKNSCASSDHKESTWENIDWNKCEKAVSKLQARIVKAQKEGKFGKVKALQWTLTHSFYSKALAVRRVTSNDGKRLRALTRYCGQPRNRNTKPSSHSEEEATSLSL